MGFRVFPASQLGALTRKGLCSQFILGEIDPIFIEFPAVPARILFQVQGVSCFSLNNSFRFCIKKSLMWIV
jgi:hypothetical protein